MMEAKKEMPSIKVEEVKTATTIVNGTAGGGDDSHSGEATPMDTSGVPNA